MLRTPRIDRVQPACQPVVMKHRLTSLVAVAVLGLGSVPGCDDATNEANPDKTMNKPEESAKDELQKAGEHLKEAGTIAAEEAKKAMTRFGDVLEQEWDSARESAYDTQDEVAKAYEQALQTADRQLEEWREEAETSSTEALDELDRTISESRQELTELRESGEENWEATRRAFNVGWQELRDAYAKAKAEFRESSGGTDG